MAREPGERPQCDLIVSYPYDCPPDCHECEEYTLETGNDIRDTRN